MFKLTWRNLMRNKRRTFLTLASVGLAIFLLTLLSSVLDALTNPGDVSSARRLVVRNAISLTFDLPEAYWQRLDSIEHVVAVTPLNWFQGVYKDTRMENFFPRFSSDPNTLLDVFPEIEIDPAQYDAFKAERTAFITGRALAEAQGWSIGDKITIKGDIYPVDLELTLRGVFKFGENESQEKILYFHRDYLEEALDNPGSVGTYFMLVDDPENAAGVVKSAEQMFANSASQVRAETEEAFGLSFVQMLGNVRFLFGSIGLAIVVSIFLITANTMAMAARERTREVSVLRTLGFRKSQVVTMVILEAVAVGVFGALLGIVLANSLLSAAQPILDQTGFGFGSLAFNPIKILQAMGLGVVLGLLSATFPAIVASRMRIVDGLRRIA
jgi:putative ABC transport system permease protein